MTKNQVIQEKAEATPEMVNKVVTDSLPQFTKEQLTKSYKYSHRRDALNALLKDGETYSFAQVDEILKEFYEGGKK